MAESLLQFHLTPKTVANYHYAIKLVDAQVSRTQPHRT